MIDRRAIVAGFAAMTSMAALPALAQEAQPPAITMEWLRERVRSYLAAKPEVERITPAGPNGLDVILRSGRRIELGLDNLLRRLEANPSAWRAMLTEHQRAVDEVIARGSQAQAAPRLEDLMIVMRNESVFANVDAGQAATVRRLLSRPLFGRVRAYVVVDSPRNQRYLTIDDPIVVSSTPDRIHIRALSNTEAKFNRVRMLQRGDLFIVDIDPNYNSSILIADRFWRNREEALGGSVAVAVPTREAVVFGKADLASDMRRLFADERRPYPVADGPLIYSQGNWRAA
jgi:hypothetical protein